VLDVIGTVAFGFDFNALAGNGLAKHAERFMEEITNPFAYLPLWHYLPTPGNLSMKEAMRVLQEKAHVVIAERRKILQQGEIHLAADQQDLLHVLLQQDSLTGESLDSQTVVANSIFFMVAGHESTSTALSWMLYLLAQHPEIQTRARNEIDSQLGDHRQNQPTLDDYLKLKFVEMIIKEGLRLYPPAAFNVRTSIKDTTLGGYKVAKGTHVFFPVREIHRHSASFSEPKKFDPDRWQPENLDVMQKGSFLPFNLGVHNCIGQRFAMIEMRVVLATMLQRFEFLPVAGFKPQLTIHFMRPKHGIRVYVKERSAKE